MRSDQMRLDERLDLLRPERLQLPTYPLPAEAHPHLAFGQPPVDTELHGFGQAFEVCLAAAEKLGELQDGGLGACGVVRFVSHLFSHSTAEMRATQLRKL